MFRLAMRFLLGLSTAAVITFGSPVSADDRDVCDDSYDRCYAVCYTIYGPSSPAPNDAEFYECVKRCALYYHICESIRDEVPIVCPPQGGPCY